MDIAQLGLSVDSTAVARGSRELKKFADTSKTTESQVTRSTNKMSGSMKSFARSLLPIASAAAAAFASINFLRIADEMRALDNQVRNVTSSEKERLAVQKQLLGVANRNLQDIGATTELYVANRRALKELGKSQAETIQFTDNLSKTFLVGGASAASQAGAIRQLGQALASGALRGDEFNSIAENAPVIMDLLSESLGVARGQLREMAADGMITSEIIYNAVSKATEGLDELVGSMQIGIEQAMTTLVNNGKVKLGEFLNSTTGVSGSIASVIMFLARNIDTLISGAFVAAGAAVMYFAGTVNIASSAVGVLGRVILANPIFLVAAVLAAIAVKTYGLQGALDELGKAFDFVGKVFSDVLGLIMTGFGGLIDLAGAVYTNIASGAADSTNQSSGFFGDFFDGTGSGFDGLMIKAARVFDAIGGFAMGMAIYAGERIAWFVGGASNAFTSLGNFASGIFEGVVNTVVRAINLGAQKINELITMANNATSKIPFFGDGMQVGMLGQLDEISLGRGALQSMPEVSLSGAIDDGFAKQGGALEKLARQYTETTTEAEKLSNTATEVGAAMAGSATGTDKATKATKEAADAANQLWQENQRTVESLQFEADTLGFTTEAIQMRRLALNGATAAQMADADAALMRIKLYEQEAEAKDKILQEQSRLGGMLGNFDPIAGEQEQYAKDLQDLRSLNELKLIEDQRYLEIKAQMEREHVENMMMLEEERFRQQSYGNELLMASLDQLEQSATNTITGLLSGATSTTEAFQNLGQAIFKEVVGGLVQMGIAQVKNFVMARAQQAISTAAGVAQGATLAGAYAPAAAAASVATVGAAPGIGLSALSGVIPAMLALFSSFDGGGFTGYGSRSGGIDGKGGFPAIMHPNETVIDHTKGQTMGGGTTVIIQNAPAGTREERSQGADGREIVNVILGDMRSGGPISRGMGQTFGLSRKGT